jgi:hypothetical protein
MYQTNLSFVTAGEAASLPLKMVLPLIREQGQWHIRQGFASQIVQ